MHVFMLSLVALSTAMGTHLPGVAAAAAGAPSHDLRSWLQDLVLPLPAFALNLSVLPIPIKISGGNCTELFLGHVAVHNETNKSAMVSHIVIGDFSIKCAVDVIVEGIPIHAKVQISRLNVSMSLAIDHDSGTPPVPTLIGWSSNDTNGCLIQPGLASLKLLTPDPDFQKILDQVPALIVPMVNSAGPKICTAIENFFVNTLSSFLPLIGGFLNAPADLDVPELPVVPGGDFVLNETSAMSVILAMLADTLHWDNPEALDAKLQSLLQPFTQPRPAKHSWDLALSSAMKLGIQVDGETLIDIEQFKRLRIEAFNTTANINVALQRLGAMFKGTVRLDAGSNGGVYECSASGGFNVSDVQLRVKAQVGMEKNKLDVLKFDQFLTGAGLLSMIENDFVGGTPPQSNNGLEMLGLSMNVTPALGIQIHGQAAKQAYVATGRRMLQSAFASEGSGPGASLEEMLTSSVDTLVGSIFDVYGSTLRGLVNGLLGSLGRMKVNQLLANMTASRKPVQPSKLDADTWVSYMNIAPIPPITCLVLSLLIFAGGFVQQLFAQRSPGSPTVGASPGNAIPKKTSLLFSGAVPVSTGLALIMVMCFTLFLCIPASSGVGTTLFVNLTEGDRFSVSPAIHWSLLSSFEQMMNAQAYLLAWSVMFASGIWPYTKLLILFSSMVVRPTKFLDVKLRQRVLVFVDAVGKVSLLDSFFMFLYETLISVQWANEAGSKKFSATIEPEGGFVLFFGATIMCLLLGHCVLVLHRLTLHQDRTRDSLGGECFSLHLTAPRWIQCAVPAALVVSMVLFPFALFNSALHTKVTGGLGLFYSLVDKDPVLEVRIWDVLTGPAYVLGYGEFVQPFWRNILTTLSLLFGVILPACFCIGLGVLWFLPLRRKGRFAGLAIVQCLRAWAALDVCAFTCFIGWFGGPPFFRSFTMDPSQAFSEICKGLHSTFDTYCFDLEVYPMPGLWIAFVWSAIITVTSMIISRQADLWLNMSGACESRTLMASGCSEPADLNDEAELPA